MSQLHTSRVHRVLDGFDLLGLENDQVEIWVAPELGGKWVSLRDRRSGREWMWSPPDRKGLFRAPDSNAFHSSCLVGADECIPTIAPARWQGRDLPDHGEVWNIPWQVIEADETDSKSSITLTVQMPVSPFRITRTMQLQGSALTVDYLLENLGHQPEHFVWAFHPLLTLEADDQLELGPNVTELLVEASTNLSLGQRGSRCPWPRPAPGIDLAHLDLGDTPAAIKLFTQPLTQPADGRAAIRNARLNTSLTYSFDVNQVNTLGIWLTRGAWNGYHHLAVEPGIGAPDPLDVAHNEWGRTGTVAPQGEISWSFQLLLGPA